MTPALANIENGETGTSQDLEEGLKEDVKPIFCQECGNDCTRVRYHCSKNPPASATTPKPTKEQRYDICPTCWRETRFPSGTVSGDYTKLENERYRSIADKEAPWSDSELLLLLEGLEMFDDSWDSVASHVGSRGREECVLKFLQLEIEDPYHDDAPSSAANIGQSMQNGHRPKDLAFLSGGRVPYGQMDNPVLSVMGFLAGLADPGVTAQAAGKSVEEMRKSLRGRIEREATPGAENSDGAPKNSAASIKKSTSPSEQRGDRAESMDVDDTTSLADRVPPAKSNDLPTTALALTAARAAALASHTERQLTSQVSAAVNLQLTKLELKMQQFSEMEALLQAERREVERMRQRLFLDRLAFRKRVKETEQQLEQRISVAAGIKMGAVPAGSEGLGLGEDRGLGDGVEPYGEGMEGFMRHEI